MPGNRCSNCIAYNLDCTYVEAAKVGNPVTPSPFMPSRSQPVNSSLYAMHLWISVNYFSVPNIPLFNSRVLFATTTGHFSDQQPSGDLGSVSFTILSALG